MSARTLTKTHVVVGLALATVAVAVYGLKRWQDTHGTFLVEAWRFDKNLPRPCYPLPGNLLHGERASLWWVRHLIDCKKGGVDDGEYLSLWNTEGVQGAAQLFDSLVPPDQANRGAGTRALFTRGLIEWTGASTFRRSGEPGWWANIRQMAAARADLLDAAAHMDNLDLRAKAELAAVLTCSQGDPVGVIERYKLETNKFVDKYRRDKPESAMMALYDLAMFEWWQKVGAPKLIFEDIVHQFPELSDWGCYRSSALMLQNWHDQPTVVTANTPEDGHVRSTGAPAGQVLPKWRLRM